MKIKLEGQWLAFDEAGHAFLLPQPVQMGDVDNAAIGNLNFVGQWPSEQDAENMRVWHLTSSGRMKCTRLTEYRGATRKAGLQGFKLLVSERIVRTFITKDEAGHIFVASRFGRIHRFEVSEGFNQRRKDAATTVANFWRRHGEFQDIACDAFFLNLEEALSCTIGALTSNGYAARFSAAEVKSKIRLDEAVLIGPITEETGPIAGVGPANDGNPWKVACGVGEVMQLDFDGVRIRKRNSNFKKIEILTETPVISRIL